MCTDESQINAGVCIFPLRWLLYKWWSHVASLSPSLRKSSGFNRILACHFRLVCLLMDWLHCREFFLPSDGMQTEKKGELLRLSLKIRKHYVARAISWWVWCGDDGSDSVRYQAAIDSTHAIALSTYFSLLRFGGLHPQHCYVKTVVF